MIAEKNEIFDFKNYKSYLRSRLSSGRWGQKAALAKVADCQPTYISQVLHASADLSLEQASRVNQFLGHSKEESSFFLLMVLRDRAGNEELRLHFQEQIDQILTNRMNLVSRMGARQSLSAEIQARYYSSWHYTAIHTALSVPSLQTKQELGNHFGLPLQRISTVLEFLVSAGLAKVAGDRFEYGEMDLRLGSDTADILKHHTNWRMQVMDSFERESVRDLHYSGVYSLSAADALKIKDMLLQSIQKNLSVVRDSKEEVLYAVCIDFFNLRRN